MSQGLLYVVQPGEGGGGSTRQMFIRGGSAPRSNSFIPSYTVFYEKGSPFVYLLLTNGSPFTRLSQSPSLLISGSGSWPQREGRALALSLAFAAENIRTFKSTARASCSWKFWGRLVGKSTPSHTLFTPLHPFYPLYMYCRLNRNQSQK